MIKKETESRFVRDMRGIPSESVLIVFKLILSLDFALTLIVFHFSRENAWKTLWDRPKCKISLHDQKLEAIRNIQKILLIWYGTRWTEFSKQFQQLHVYVIFEG